MLQFGVHASVIGPFEFTWISNELMATFSSSKKNLSRELSGRNLQHVPRLQQLAERPG